MATHTHLLLFTLVVIALEQGRHLGAALTCNGDGPCRCTMSDGTGTVDISSIGNQDGTPRFQDSYDFNGVAYSYNPCFSFSAADCKDAAVCQKDFSGGYSGWGTQSSAVWTYTGYYPQVTYTSSTGRRTEILLICDMAYVNPNLDVFGELEAGIVGMNLWSKCACPGECPRVDPKGGGGEGLTPGSIMLIIFFVVLFVYLAAGMSYNYARNKTVGKEMLPNFTFWAALPALIKAGFTFSWDFVCRRKGTKEYEEL